MIIDQPEGQQLPPPELDEVPPELEPVPELEPPELEPEPEDDAPEDPPPELDAPLEPELESSPPSGPVLVPMGTALLHCARASAAPPAARSEKVAKEKRFDAMASSRVERPRD